MKEHLGVGLQIVKHAWTGMRGGWAPEGTNIDWDTIMPKGFHVLPKRWVVERTFGWITRYRRLSRDFEGTHSSSEAFISLAMTKRMASKLARLRTSTTPFYTLSDIKLSSFARHDTPWNHPKFGGLEKRNTSVCSRISEQFSSTIDKACQARLY